MELRPFKDMKQDKQIPKNPGIYIIFNKDQIIYVGQSCNIRERLQAHLRYSKNPKAIIKEKLKGMYEEEAYCAKYRYITYQFYLTIGANIDDIYYVYNEYPIEELNEKEYFYIQKHQPRYNVEGVLKPYVGVNRNKNLYEQELKKYYKHKRIERHLDKLYQLGRKQEKYQKKF